MEEGRETATQKVGADRLRFLIEITKTFAEATADHERVFQIVAERTAKFMDACVVLGLISEDRAFWTPVAQFCEDTAAGRMLERFLEKQGRLPLGEHHLASMLAQAGHAIVVQDPIPDALRRRLNGTVLAMFEEIGARSVAVLPLAHGGQLLGTLTLARVGNGARRFEGVDLDVLQILSGHAALTLANARLVEAVRRELAEHTRTREALAHSEEKALRTQRMEAAGRLAGGVAHDFNNLLSVILSYAEMVADEMREDDPLRFATHEILVAGRRAAEVTRQLLAFSRQQVLKPREIGLNGVVVGIDKMLRRLLGEDIDIRTHLARDLKLCRVDPSQIELVIMELVLNARDAMPHGGRITIATCNVELDEAHVVEHPEATVGPHVMLSIADNGVGMEESTISRIFEPFFTTKPANHSAGLGLSGVYGIVRQSGGSIAVESAVGRGTVMRVYLPRVERSIVTGPGLASSPLPSSNAVLVVEPDPQLCSLLREMLERSGHKVHVARDEGEAILLAQQRTAHVGLLVCDLDDLRERCSALCERLREAWPEMHVLFIASAVVSPDVGARVLAKPISADALLNSVQEAFGASAG